MVVYSQSEPFAQVNATWHYNYTPESASNAYLKIHAEKDTIINGKNCSELIRTIYSYSFVSQTYSNYIVDTNYVSTEGDKVLLFRVDTFFTIYDFSLEAGDSLIIPASVYSPQLDSIGCYHIVSKGDTVINGRLFKYIDVYSKIPTQFTDGYDWGYNGRILEDIGPLSTDLFPTQQRYAVPPDYICASNIRCFSDSLFMFQVFICDYLVNIQEYNFNRKSISVYPNPTACKFTVSVSDNNPHDCIVINNKGKIILSFEAIQFPFEIDATSLDAGNYFIVINGNSKPLIKL